MVRKFFLDKLMVLLILLAPILRYYDVPILNIGFEPLLSAIILVLGAVLLICKQNTTSPAELKRSRNWYGLFLIWMVIITLIFELFTEINVNAPLANYNIRALVVPLMNAMIIYILLSGKVNTDSCIKIYTFFVRLIVVIYLFQWLLVLVGVRISFKLPFEYNEAWGYMAAKTFGMQPYPTALFSEKSHICEYLVPYIAICLYSDSIVRKDRIKKAIFYSICVISTVSGNGIVLVALIWFMYFIFFGNFKSKNQKVLVAVCGITILIGGYLVLSTIPRFSDMFSVLFVDNSGSEFSSSKADYRIYRGIDIFLRNPIWSQITGVGYKHMFMFSQKFGIVSFYDKSRRFYEYFSAISAVALYGGAIGLFTCAKHYWALFKSKIHLVKGLIIVMIALWFSTEMLFNGTHIMYILLIISVLCGEFSVTKSSLEGHK